MSAPFATLAAAFMDLLLEPGADAALDADPRGFAAARGLDVADQQAFARSSGRLQVYRRLVRTTLLEPLSECFPVCEAALGSEGLWVELQDAFLASRSVQSLYYRDIPGTFVAWLAETRPHAGRVPYLLPLAHYEYLELELLRHPDGETPTAPFAAPALDRRLVPDATLRALTYAWRVHRADRDDPVPEPGTVHLVCHRGTGGFFHSREVAAPASAFLVRALAGEPLGPAAAGVGLDPDAAFGFLEDLRAEGGVAGYR